MNRRGFASALTAGMAAWQPAMAASGNTSSLREGLFLAPQQWVSHRFVTQQGIPLTLQQVHEVSADPRLSQWRLEFRADQPLSSGLHQLHSESGEQISVHLESMQNHRAVAVVSRLRQA